MPVQKPYHRNYRAVRSGQDRPNAGYSSWAYITDSEYAVAGEHYVRSFLILQSDLQRLFEYVEPSDVCLSTYSVRIHEMLMRACIEVEANCKAILRENIHTPQVNRFGQPILNMSVYRRINTTHHLSSYEVSLPTWSGGSKLMRPFECWAASGAAPGWYQDYNESKHDRMMAFRRANFGSLIQAIAGLLVLLASQFKDHGFSAGPMFLSMGDYIADGFESAIGSLFRIKYPDDWTDDEIYDFDWARLSAQADRFGRIDYNAL